MVPTNFCRTSRKFPKSAETQDHSSQPQFCPSDLPLAASLLFGNRMGKRVLHENASFDATVSERTSTSGRRIRPRYYPTDSSASPIPRPTCLCGSSKGKLTPGAYGSGASPALGLPGSGMAGKLDPSHLQEFPAIYIWQEPDPAGGKFAASLVTSCRKLCPKKAQGHRPKSLERPMRDVQGRRQTARRLAG